jgi:hypothetical protein
MSWGFYVMIAFFVVALIRSFLDHLFNPVTREAKAERKAAEMADRERW